MYKVSVIIPAYNSGECIQNALKSVLEQTYVNLEVIVVDDGSEDETFKIASSIDDARVNVYTIPHSGLSAARNFGLEASIGDFIYFMDSDDSIEPNLIEENLDILREEELNFVVWGYYRDYLDEHNVVQKRVEVVPENITVKRRESDFVFDGNHIDLLGYAWNKLYKRNFFIEKELRFEVGTSLIEDVLFNTQVFLNDDTIRFNGKSYYHYNCSFEESLLTRFRMNAFSLIKKRRTALKRWTDDWKINEAEKLLSYSFISGIRYCMFNLFSNDNELTFSEKYNYAKKMFSDLLTRELVNSFEPDSEELEMYKKLIQEKDPDLLCRKLQIKYGFREMEGA